MTADEALAALQQLGAFANDVAAASAAGGVNVPEIVQSAEDLAGLVADFWPPAAAAEDVIALTPLLIEALASASPGGGANEGPHAPGPVENPGR